MPVFKSLGLCPEKCFLLLTRDLAIIRSTNHEVWGKVDLTFNKSVHHVLFSRLDAYFYSKLNRLVDSTTNDISQLSFLHLYNS